jgi:hypothetical protein
MWDSASLGRVTRAAADPHSSDDATGTGSTHPESRVILALAGLREPVVVILLAIAFFTGISGKPLDGVLILVVAVGLAWDAGHRARNGGVSGTKIPNPLPAGPEVASEPGNGAASQADAGQPATASGHAARARAPASGLGRLAAAAGLLAGGVLCAWLAGTFIRYSWPATAAVTVAGAIVVLTGWRGPLLDRPARNRLPVVGTALWVVVLVFGCLWELVSLLRQPSLTATSYAHPTISALTDPVLASAGGRTAVLAAWLAIGWYLVRR